MKLVLRWFPYGDDSVTLQQIRQIPGVSGVATHLTRIPVGDVWTMDEINLVKDEINSYGLEMEVIESLNIHEDIKKGLPSRDMLIDNYIESMRNLSKAGVKCICYNFMPVMDWYRSDLAKALSDGSTAMAYSHEVATKLTLESITSSMIDGANDFSLPSMQLFLSLKSLISISQFILTILRSRFSIFRRSSTAKNQSTSILISIHLRETDLHSAPAVSAQVSIMTLWISPRHLHLQAKFISFT